MKRAAVNRGDNAERNRLKRAFQAKAQADSERYCNNIADDAEEALQRNDMKTIYKAVRHISGKQSVGQGIFPARRMVKYVSQRKRPCSAGKREPCSSRAPWTTCCATSSLCRKFARY